jgi:hypothetical protein
MTTRNVITVCLIDFLANLILRSEGLGNKKYIHKYDGEKLSENVNQNERIILKWILEKCVFAL